MCLLTAKMEGSCHQGLKLEKEYNVVHGKWKALGAVVLAGGLIMGSATAASAAPSIGGGTVTCQFLTQQVSITSSASGRVNHKEGVTVLGSWNNGSTPVWRQSNTNKSSIPSWSAYLTGTGGNVYQASASCV